MTGDPRARRRELHRRARDQADQHGRARRPRRARARAARRLGLRRDVPRAREALQEARRRRPAARARARRPRRDPRARRRSRQAAELYRQALELAPGDFTVLSALVDFHADMRHWRRGGRRRSSGSSTPTPRRRADRLARADAPGRRSTPTARWIAHARDRGAARRDPDRAGAPGRVLPARAAVLPRRALRRGARRDRSRDRARDRAGPAALAPRRSRATTTTRAASSTPPATRAPPRRSTAARSSTTRATRRRRSCSRAAPPTPAISARPRRC